MKSKKFFRILAAAAGIVCLTLGFLTPACADLFDAPLTKEEAYSYLYHYVSHEQYQPGGNGWNWGPRSYEMSEENGGYSIEYRCPTGAFATYFIDPVDGSTFEYVTGDEAFDFEVNLKEYLKNHTDPLDFNAEEQPAAYISSYYQGIFKKNDTYISIALYTDGEIGGPIGIVYNVAAPYIDNAGIVKADVLNTVGELYDYNGSYKILGNETEAFTLFGNEKFFMYGSSAYNGSYVQVSNAGANMRPVDVWLRN